MKTGIAMLVGTGMLSLAVGVGTAAAATGHHHRHLARSQTLQTPAMQGPAARSDSAELTSSGNNPAKKYQTRHMPDGALKTSTVPTTGNNLSKAYAVRHAPEHAMSESTLPTSGNNPVKRYPKTETTGAASR